MTPKTQAVDAIHKGDIATLAHLLDAHPELAHARIDGSRTLLHIATDWPGHFPAAAAAIALLAARGADIDARMTGAPHQETPLHWAASCNDVAALDALLDAGADIESGGAVIGGGTAMADAVAFAQWDCARRLLERGASTTLWQAAALGLSDRVEAYLAQPQSPRDLDNALWSAGHGGQRVTAQLLLNRGANRHWIGHDHLTAAGAARRGGFAELADWLG